MQIDIIQLDPIPLLCAREQGHYAEAAPRAWERLMRFAYGQRLMTPQTRAFGLSHDDPNLTEPERIRYDACLDLDIEPPADSGLLRGELAGGRYARLLHRGPYENLSETYAYALQQWLPQSGEQLRDAPCFEHYRNRDPRRTKPENLRTEVHIPLSAKQ